MMESKRCSPYGRTAISFVMSAVVAMLLTGLCPVVAQTIYGTSGLVTVPTASVLGDRVALLGLAYARDRWVTSGAGSAWYYQWAVYGAVGLFSRVEFVIRISGVPGAPLTDTTLPYSYPVDRMISVKGLVLKEDELVPALSIGIQDIEGKPRRKQFNSLYAVCSKALAVPVLDSITLHLGYGSDLWDKITSVSNDHRLIGVFGGFELKPLPFLGLMAEYDAVELNLGARLAVEDWPSLQLMLTDRGSVGLSLQYAMHL